jgi:hypothetical protein
LAVALVAVPALAQGQQQAQVIITVSCSAGQLSANPAKVEKVKIGTPIQWRFDASLRTCGPLQQPAGTFSVDQIKITFAPTSPFADTVITINSSQFAPSGDLVTTQARNAQNVGSHKYQIEFLRATQVVAKINGQTTVIEVTPTLTEWGLMALAVLLAGGMGYMLYRRRPALHPAAP